MSTQTQIFSTQTHQSKLSTASPATSPFVRNQFTWVDYVAFGGLILVSVSIGAYHALREGKRKSTVDFLMGGKQMSILPMSLSIVAAFMSAIALLGTAGEVYLYGSQYMIILCCYPIFTFLCVTFYLPVFFELNITSVFEYLEMRFSKVVRMVASVLFILQMTLYMAMVLLQPCLAFATTTGLNKWATVVSIGVACTLYVTLGGMKAVVWNDVIQVTLMYVALSTVLIKGVYEAGGIAKTWETNDASGRIEFFQLDPNPFTRHSVWSLLIGGTFMWLAVYGCNQAIIQKALSCPSLKNARTAIWINVPGIAAVGGLSALCGLAIYPHIKDCDPLMTNEIESHSQIMPLFVMRYMNWPGFPGLFVAGAFSASLSTLAAGINSLAAVAWKDFMHNFCCSKLDDHHAAILSKILALFFGVLITALTYPISLMGGLLQAALGLFGMLGGPVLGVFTLGLFFAKANRTGAIVGLVASMFATLYIGCGYYILKPNLPMKPRTTENCTDPIFHNITLPPPRAPLAWYFKIHELSYLYYGLLALVVALVFGLATSACTGWRKVCREDLKLLSPPIATLWLRRIDREEDEQRKQARERGLVDEMDEMLQMKNIGKQNGKSKNGEPKATNEII